MFSSSIVWAVGGIASVSSSASFAYWSRMWFSWPSRQRQLLVGQAETGEVGDVLDVASGQAGHGPMIAHRTRGRQRALAYRSGHGDRCPMSRTAPEIRPMRPPRIVGPAAERLRAGDFGDRDGASSSGRSTQPSSSRSWRSTAERIVGDGHRLGARRGGLGRRDLRRRGERAAAGLGTADHAAR